MKMRVWILCLTFLLSLPPAAGLEAAEVEAEGRIEAVTVFPDRAEVTRTVELALPAGQSTVSIAGLSASHISESVRVRGSGSATLKIGSVETRQVHSEAAVQEDERRLEREIEGLNDRRRALEDKIAALKVQLDFIKAIGREGPKTANEELVRGKMDPKAWKEAWSFLGSGTAEAFEGIHAAQREQRELDRKVAQMNRQLSQIRTGRKASVTARVHLELAAPAKARLELSYQLPGASWRPLYDARLDTETGRIGLTQIGEVRQRTGEDWSGVQLTLSTARPAASARMPDLSSWFIDFAQVYPVSRVVLSQEDTYHAELELDVLNEEGRIAGGEDSRERFLAKAPEPVAEVIASEFAAEYRIAGRVEVPSDNAPHKFVIGERAMAAELAVRVVPKVTPRAYLYAEVELPGEEPLLPGPVSVLRDGAFVGTSGIGLLRPGEEHKFSFGVDDKVRVDYRLVDGERSREGLIAKDRRLERRYLTEVVNHHERPIEITVLDQLPVPRDERIEVELLKDSTPPSETDVEERKGVLAWSWIAAPGEERAIRFGYAVVYPEGESLPGF